MPAKPMTADPATAHPWVVPILSPEERAAQLLAAESAAGRDRWRDHARTAASCVGWLVLGLFLVAWAVHTTNQRWAGSAFWGGLVIGNSGLLMTLVAAYRRGEKRGDW